MLIASLGTFDVFIKSLNHFNTYMSELTEQKIANEIFIVLFNAWYTSHVLIRNTEGIVSGSAPWHINLLNVKYLYFGMRQKI